MKSKLLRFLQTGGTMPTRHGSRTIFKHCSQTSAGNPMACVHGQPWLTVAAFDAEDGKKSMVVGMYSPLSRGHPAVLRHPEIIYTACEHCTVPMSYVDDVYGTKITANADGINAVESAADGFLKRIKMLNIMSVETDITAITV